uniref:(northern house mosquito) hypothetical protein n=1 Tax=Culex pipiens TaxID=7175 RepID=A0A8D8KF94_CULPI
MAVHLLAGSGRGCGPAPANIDRQQRSAAAVPQQLLRQVAQQFADSRPLEPRVPVFESGAVCAAAVCLPLHRVVRLQRAQEGRDGAGVRNLYRVLAAGVHRVRHDVRGVGAARPRAQLLPGAV